MALLLFLNELSCSVERCRDDEIEAAMTGLIAVLRAVREQRMDAALVTAMKLFHIQLALDYPLSKWASDNRNRDRVRYIRSFENRAPFSAAGLIDPDGLVEYFYGEQRAEGLGYAHGLDGLALSFRLTDRWDTDAVPLHRRTLAESDDGQLEVVNEPVTARHAATPGHVAVHETWLVKTKLVQVRTGSELWARRADLFPHMDFLARVQGDLASLSGGHLRPVEQRLHELEQAMTNWDPSLAPTPVWRSKVTPEAEQRKALCHFIDTDGVSRLFDLHARFTPGAGRIHFRLDAAARRLVVAYIGKKLQ